MSVALVTDSTASLRPETARGRDVAVVPLQVVIGAQSYDEGVDGGATPELVAEALRAWTPVSTSRPAPMAFLAAYEAAAAAGATSVVSVHISAEMSGTYESAQLAAKESPIPVVPVDSRQVGMSLGFAVLAAADARDAGADAEGVAAAARERAAATTSLFYVDTLEYLRRGGRMGAAAALVGSALSVKPILRIADGKVGPFERVRTSGRALARLEELAVEAAGESSVDAAVFHLAAADRAGTLAGKLSERLGARLAGRQVILGELGAVLGAHVGPGMVAVSVSIRP
ncbi:MAG: degV family protein [Nocardioidaceae bacterium]|nr:degV family protein [Nocardioidaceae bacterium]